MKFFVLAAATITTFTAGGFGVKAFLKPSPTVVETTQVTSASLGGNVTEERLKATPQVVALNKTVLKIKPDKSRLLFMNEEVSFTSSQRVANAIKELNAASSEDIYLLLDSPGGSVIDGATVISAMESSKAHVNTVCTRLCASMAAMIHSYGTKRYATDRAILMYHPASGGAQGQVPNMLSQLMTLTRYLDKMVANVTSRSKVSKEEYDRLVSYELWIDSEDAQAKGLADGIVDLDVPSHEDGPGMNGGSGDKNRKTPKTPRPIEIQLIAPDNELHYWGIERAGQN